MKKVNALKIRQSLGAVLKTLQKHNEPIIIEKGREPVAVLISLNVFNERFIDYREQKKRDAILQLATESSTKVSKDSLTILRELRYGKNH